jgi:hypothetical protein
VGQPADYFKRNPERFPHGAVVAENVLPVGMTARNQ